MSPTAYIRTPSGVAGERLAGLAPEATLPPASYTRAASDAVYARLMDEARAMLAAGRSVIVDAVFADPAERASIAELAAQALVHGVPGRVEAGLTGFGGDSELLQRWLAEELHLDPARIHFCSDMEIAYRASFATGEGYLVYAGTGSIGAFVDSLGRFHRAGGRGVVLDDGGGGFWIAKEALRHIWRLEDEQR